jgi:hypothetical protein
MADWTRYAEPISYSNTFVAKVDWDIDFYGAEGCHGSDWFFDDDPVELRFHELRNGDFLVEGFNNNYILTRDSKLMSIRYGVANDSSGFHEYQVTPTTNIPIRTSSTWFIAYAANEELWDCYIESGNLNSHLNSHQRSAVTSFFFAASHAVPCSFEIPTDYLMEHYLPTENCWEVGGKQFLCLFRMETPWVINFVFPLNFSTNHCLGLAGKYAQLNAAGR